MKKLTKQEAIEEHRKMWNWIADKTKEKKKYISKEDYLEEYDVPFEDIPINHCYCCEYVHNKLMKDDELDRLECHKYCPVVWANEDLNSENPLCLNEGSEYDLWLDEKDIIGLANLARRIANLPVREDENEEIN